MFRRNQSCFSKAQGLAADHVSEKEPVGKGRACHRPGTRPRPNRPHRPLDQQLRSLFSTPRLATKSSPTFWSHLRPQADMSLVQISTQRCGRWLAALLLLPAQQAFSLSDQMLKEVDYPVLPLFGPMLTVCNYYEGSPLSIIPPN